MSHLRDKPRQPLLCGIEHQTRPGGILVAIAGILQPGPRRETWESTGRVPNGADTRAAENAESEQIWRRLAAARDGKGGTP